MATVYDIIATKGTTLQQTLAAKDDSGNAIDLTNCTVSGFVRLKYSDTGILLDLAPTIVSGFVSGLIEINVDPVEFVDLPITQAVYDINVYHISGITEQPFRGKFNIAPAATV
jgi:hypothetical protein